MANRTILAATDFSPHAQRALMQAEDLAQQLGARLVVVHVLPERGVLARFFGAEVSVEAEEHAAGEQLAAVLASLSNPGVEVEGSLVRGHAAAVIVAATEHHEPLVLVVGAQGRGSLRDAIFGTTAERLLERARCPVLAVRRSSRRRYERVLVAIDLGAAASSTATLATASRLFPEASVFALHVFEAPFEMKLRSSGVSQGEVRRYRAECRRRVAADLDDFLRKAEERPGGIEPLVRIGVTSRQILGAAKELRCDLIAVGRNGSLASDLFLGSVSKHVLREAKTDVLVVANAPRA